MLVKVTDTSFVRDTTSMGLSNTDVSARNEYQAKLNMLRIQKEQHNNVQQQIDALKNDVCEIKDLLIKLLEK
jgi:hypothetical protein